ncbi:BON domain-containing protein [Bordetella genomosp. 13]|uniref:BON domain-containing protein n=1 Tax=Bordetella genomosp. 13 TaxID=463040 RepID=UPI0011A07F8E|nr:BON domain-containing protein [Bordetella genomosp. 13]
MMNVPAPSRAPLLAALLACAVALPGCVPLIVGGAAATTAVVATDRRTSGIQLEDQNIAFKAQSQISQKLGDAARINATSYEGRVLLTGDVPSDAAKAEATSIAQRVEHAKTVYNQLTVGPAASFGTRSNDSWLSSKVHAALLNARYVPASAITVTTDRGVVYLMGKVTKIEGDYAASTVSGVGGVAKVVKLFDIISRDEAVRLSGGAKDQVEPNKSGSAEPAAPQAPIEDSGASATSVDTGGSMQTMPIK